MTDGIISIPASATFTPEQALAHASKEKWQEVIIIGWNEDGDHVIRSSRMTRAEANWLLDLAKHWAIHGGRDD